MCGILALLDPDRPVAPALYRGALALQHRGQDGAGLLTFDGRFHRHAGAGLLSEVCRERPAEAFPGHVGLAHLRYATSGSGEAGESQPFMLHYPYGLALVHNGNLTNDDALRERLEARASRLVNSGSDSETLMHVFADALSRAGVVKPSLEDLFRATQLTMATAEGAYAVVVLLAGIGLVAFRDPHGIRPLALGRHGGGVALASESVALDAIGAAFERDVAPGEALFVTLAGEVHARQLFPARPRHCAFEYIYLARPESEIDGLSVSAVREELGRSLARRFRAEVSPLDADVAFDVPSSAEDAAVAFADEAGLPYRKGIRRNAYAQRSFIAGNASLRKAMAGLKFHFERRAIAGKRLAVIDDSIVRGTTARALLDQLRARGARRIGLFSAAPPVRHPCVYGIDMAVRDDLVAATADPAEVASRLGADRLQYQTLPDLEAALGGRGACFACFNGCYPTGVGPETLQRLEAARRGTADLMLGTRPR